MTRIVAAMATIPRREEWLGQTLERLAPQVDEFRIFLQGHDAVPASVAELARAGRCEYVWSRENLGAEKKLHWAEDWRGLYFSVDDDVHYPADYVERMRAAIERWDGRAIVTAHGRAYLGRVQSIHQIAPGSLGLFHRRVDEGRWINCGGTGVMAWDARHIRMPRFWARRNILDVQVAVWAQKKRTPIWLIPHQAHWLESPGLKDSRGIYKSSQAEHHRRRNELLRSCRWNLYTTSECSDVESAAH